jgi:ABC-type multidrug transport system fused ATPase/permease subunit
VNAYLAERVDGVQIVQLYRDEERSGAEFERRNRRMKDATSTSNVYDAVMFALVDGMASICIAAMLWYGSGLAARQLGLPIAPDLTPGIVVAFIDYLDRLFRPLRDLSGKITLIQRAIASLEKVFDLLDTRVAITLGSEPMTEVKGHLVMKGVHFRYRPDSEEVLSGIDLEVLPGEVVAVVGHTGAGKTTLVRLLDRSYDGYQGSITLDGVELKDIQRDELRKRVAAVRQDIQVFTEPVRFNVDLDNRAITNERRQERGARPRRPVRPPARLGSRAEGARLGSERRPGPTPDLRPDDGARSRTSSSSTRQRRASTRSRRRSCRTRSPGSSSARRSSSSPTDSRRSSPPIASS